LYILGSEIEVAATINFKIGACYQGPDYEEEIPADEMPEMSKSKTGGSTAKKSIPNAEPEKAEVRIVTPEPELSVSESGRLFQFELGRNEFVLKSDHTEIEV
jgi:hypothetical protein